MIRSAPAGFLILLLAPLVCIAQTPSPSPSPTPTPTPTPTPFVKVVDADASGLIKLAVSETNASFRLPLEIEGSEITNLSVTVDDFAAASGARVRPTVTLDEKPATGPSHIKLNQRPVVEITASFPTAGEYKSHLVASYSGKQKNWNLIVERKKTDLTVQIDGLETAALTTGCTADALVRFTVRETSGQRLSVYPPTLEALVLKESDKVRKQARFETIELDGQEMAPGQAPTPTESSVNGQARAIGQSPTPTESYVIEPLSSRTSSFKIRGLKDPGEYVATVRISGSNGNPVTKEVTVLVKSAWYVAVFWIFLGVLGSFLIRRYTAEERPKLEALRRLGHAEEDLAEVESEAGKPTPTPVSDVFKELAKQLGLIRRSLEEGTAVNNAADRFTEMEAKIRALPEWMTTGRRINAVMPPELVKSEVIEWESLGKTEFYKRAAPTEMGASLIKIEDKVGNALVARVNEFGKKVEDYKKAHSTTAAEFDQVDIELGEARKNRGRDNWQLLTDHFQKARLVFGKALMREFAGNLKTDPPMGLESGPWLNLKSGLEAKLARLEQESDPDKWDKAYEEMNETYFGAVISGLRETIGSFTPGSPAEKGQLQAADKALTSAGGAVVSGDWGAAEKGYASAVTILEAVLAERSKKGGGQQGASITENAAQFPEMIPANLTVGSVQSVKAVAERPSVSTLSEKIARYDLLLDAGLLLIACVVGLSLLWTNDPVWGGWKSSLTALLWGLGLHQVAGSTLHGLPAIKKKITET